MTRSLLQTHRLFTRTSWLRCAAGLVVVTIAVAIGCKPGVQDRAMPFQADPIAEARALVKSYESGQPVGSETMSFDDLVARVTQADAAKGAALQAFLDEVRKNAVADKAKAKKVLESL